MKKRVRYKTSEQKNVWFVPQIVAFRGGGTLVVNEVNKIQIKLLGARWQFPFRATSLDLACDCLWFD